MRETGLGQPLISVFSGDEGWKNGLLVLLGRKDSGKGVIGIDILLALGSSPDLSCVPSDVAGLNEPVFDNVRLCAMELLGRPRF